MNGTGGAPVVPGVMKNQIKTILLLGVLSAILIGFGGMLGRQWVGIFTLLALALNRGGDDDASNPVAALALAIVAPIAATLVQLGISRSRQFLADETGARLSGDPEALASALEKLDRAAHVVPPVTAAPSTASLFIVNPFAGMRGMVSLFSTHPPMAERVRRLRGMQLVRYAA